MTRVLVADDSPTARALLAAILGGDPAVEVVGQATNGLEAVELTQRLRPQVVTMDVRMPGLDGFAATKEIMVTAPTPIVIVTATTDCQGVEVALHALRAGAVAALCKPPGPGTPGFEEASRQFVQTVKSMAQVKVVRHWRAAGPGPVPTRPPAGGGDREPVVAIAASTGGPAALQHLLSDLPGDFPAPVLLVQHITPGFTPGLAAWLNAGCDLRVKVAEPGERAAPRTVYLAPDDHHLGLSARRTILLSDGPRVGGFRPSGTFLFEAVARSAGSSAVAVVLTGMGEDGAAGLRAVRQAGGRVIAQDEQSSVVFGMPRAAIVAGLADHVLPLSQIAPRLVQLVHV